MPVIDTNHLPHTIDITPMSMQWDTPYGVYGPMSGANNTGVKALLIPGMSSEKQVEIGPLSRKLYTLIVQPTVSISQGDKVTWTDTGEVFYVDNEPMKYYCPADFPSLVEHHIECIVIKQQ